MTKNGKRRNPISECVTIAISKTHTNKSRKPKMWLEAEGTQSQRDAVRGELFVEELKANLNGGVAPSAIR